jgi:DUF1009 family protein
LLRDAQKVGGAFLFTCSRENRYIGAVSQQPAPNAIEVLGLIAGNRSYPLEFAREARRLGVRRLVAVGFENETNPELATLVDKLSWVRVGQLTRMIKAFTSEGVRHCVMAGQVAPKNLFEVRPDLRALTVLLRLKEKNAHTLFGAVVNELADAGVEVVEATPWLGNLLVSAGFHLGPKVSQEEREQIAYGFSIAKETARLDIGQMVVVKDGAVLAVEAFEGTDQCLLRGGSLAGENGGAVAVKVTKPGHDFRFDIPCFGPSTVQTCADAGVRVLAIEPGRTIVLERPTTEQLTRKLGVSVVAIK